MWNNLVFAQENAPESPETAAPSSLLGNPMLMLVAFGAIMYFFLFRPNQRREKQRREMLASLAKGDQVVTSGGLCGTIVGLTEKMAVLRVTDDANVKIEFLRSAISQVTSSAKDKRE